MNFDIESQRQLIVEKKNNRESFINEILQLPDFRSVAITAKLNLPSQSYGEVIQRWFKDKFGWDSISASDTSGDVKVFGYNVEVKASVSDDGRKYNYVQIRLTHDIDYYFLPTFNCVTDTGYLFLLDHSEMEDMVSNYGGYAHGCIKDNGEVRDNLKNPHKLFAIRPTFDAKGLGNKAWRSLLQYNKFSTEEEIYDRKIWEKSS